MWMRKRLEVALLAVALLFPALAAAQLTTGDVYGTVTDEHHQPLPGVTLTLSGVGGPKVAQADDHGNFRFTGLDPGTYALKAELDGFSTVDQNGIEVTIGSKRSLALTMSSAVRETITVTAEHATLNPREQNAGPVLTPTELEKVPTARDPWSLLRQAPGVQTDRINVGGNESGQQSNFFVGGATSSDNTFAVDGAIETDMAAVGGSAGYYDFGAYEEFQLTTASTDVSIQTAGVTINQVTKRGTNDWKGDARLLETEGSWQAKPSTEGYTPGIVGNQIADVKEYGANFGGPLVHDHLWLWGAYGVSKIDNLLGVSGQHDKTKLEDTNIKTNFQWGGNSGSVLYWKNDKIKLGRSASATRPPETTLDQTTPATRWKFEDTQIFGSNFTLSALYAKNDGAFTLEPEGGRAASLYQDGDGVYHGSFWFFDQKATIDQGKLDGSWYLGSGDWNQEIKFGASYRTQQNDSNSALPGVGYAVIDCAFWGCDSSLDPSSQVAEWSRYHPVVKSKYAAGWVQDTISHDRLTVTAGVRWDKQTADNLPHVEPAQAGVPGDLLPQINFAGDDAGGLDWNSVVPRVGVTYALGQDRRTLVRGTFSRYAAQLGQWVANYVSPTGAYSYVYAYWTDANHNLRIDPNERDSLYTFYTPNVNTVDPTKSANIMDPNLKPYMTNEVTLGLQHGFRDFSVSATLQYRETTDLLDRRALVQDPDGTIRPATVADYSPDPISSRPYILPDGTAVFPQTYSLNNGTGGFLLTNGDRKLEYTGITLGFDKPMSNRWSARAYFTYGDPKLKVGPKFKSYDDPTNVVSMGAGFWGDSNDIYVDQSYGTHNNEVINSRWSFNLTGIYQVAPERPWGFEVAGNVSGREGYPFVPSTGRITDATQLTPKLDTFRFQDVYDFDGRIAKDFIFNDFRLTASLDGFNLLNNQVVLERNPKAPRSTAGLATAYPVVARLSPRVFRWGLTLHFR